MLLDTVRDDPVCRRLMTAQGSVEQRDNAHPAYHRHSAVD
jgi:hypothetical protein